MAENDERLRNALRRAAHAIQGMYIGHGHKGVAGEAVIALAFAEFEPGQSWQHAVEQARMDIGKQWPNACTPARERDGV